MTDREKWLQERKKGLGGSDIGAIFNLDFGCARALAYDKTNVPEDFPKHETAEMERGTLLEPVIRQLYNMRTGRPAIKPEPYIVWSKDYAHMFVSMDAITSDALKATNGYAEFKCVNRFVMKKFKKEGLRRSYILQMQHGLHVSGFTWGSFGILCLDPWEFAYFDVNQDRELQGMLVEREAEYWGWIQDGTLPGQLQDENDKRCQSCPWRRTCKGKEFSLAPTSEGEQGEVVPTPELLPLVSEWVELDQISKAAQEHIETIKEALRGFIGDNYGISVPGARVLHPKWDETRWETKVLNLVFPRLVERIAACIVNEMDLDFLLSDYVDLLSLCHQVIKARKTSPKSSLRYYPSAD
jgi:predicted phage-related endonuclease